MPDRTTHDRDAAIISALDAVDEALYETDPYTLTGVSDTVLGEVDAWAANIQVHIALARRRREQQ